MSKLEYADFNCPVCGYIRHYVTTKGEYHLIGHELCDKKEKIMSEYPYNREKVKKLTEESGYKEINEMLYYISLHLGQHNYGLASTEIEELREKIYDLLER